MANVTQPIDLPDWLGCFPQKAVKIIFGVNRVSQRPRRMQQPALRQSVNGDFGDAQINGRFSTLESFFLNLGLPRRLDPNLPELF
jgi:hypothetical protein